MDLDARTKETVATLLGVAYNGPGSLTSSEKRHSWETNGKHSGKTDGDGNSLASSAATRHSKPPQPSSSNAVPHLSQQRSSQYKNRPQSRTGHPAAKPAPSARPRQRAADATLSMSSIGFGIDSSASSSWGDATEASIRALQDAMERSTLRLPMSMPAHHLLQIKVQIGVPPKETGSIEPMVVDESRLTSILPRAIPVLPIRVVVGGLFLKGEAQGSSSICTAVACITLQSQASPSMPEPAASITHHPIPSASAHSSPWSSLAIHQSKRVIEATVGDSADPRLAANSKSNPAPSPDSAAAPPTATNKTPASVATVKTPANKRVHSSTSIEMLAMISEEIRLAADKHGNSQPSLATGAIGDGQATNVLQHRLSADATSELTGTRAPSGAFSSEAMVLEESQLRNGNYNYKKLPPGVTTKKNQRLFVKHTYRDHSGEKPLPEEADLIGSTSTSSARTPNAAFPLKLHETLNQIENDGHGNIIGWMPHGRSFKIHKQQEFAEIILPRYFVMTKKSSFLRQLNLYGFNRFSAGPDQGSYYHEKFLRGMKFLCRRMTRQKVNGNRIRSAGNPDEEPRLSNYAICPPPVISTEDSPISSSPTNKKFTYISRKEDEYGDENHAEDQDIEDEETVNEKCVSLSNSQRNNGGVLVSFPLRLQRMLDKLEAEQETNIISWLSHGRAFLVHDPEAFVDHLMPVYFNQTKYSSFQRQLHMYNFQRITAGKDKGAYHNPNFQRGKPYLCPHMVRTRVNGKGCRKPGDPNNEPNLYSLEPLPQITAGTAIEVPDGNHEEDENDSVCS